MPGKEKPMKRWKTYFYNAASDYYEETRTLTVSAEDEDSAGTEASEEADRRGWPENLRMEIVIEIKDEEDEGI